MVAGLMRKTKTIPFNLMDFSHGTNCSMPVIWAVVTVRTRHL